MKRETFIESGKLERPEATESNLMAFARKELNDYGILSKDSDYDGMAGEAVLELMEVFCKQGHSGSSAHLVRSVFNDLAAYKPLTPLRNPTVTGEYQEVSPDGALQSTRVGSIFSMDHGKTWYDLDGKKNWKNKVCNFIWGKFIYRLHKAGLISKEKNNWWQSRRMKRVKFND